MITFIVAMDNNRVIGFNNDMPWHLPRDLQYFKKRTLGHTIIMGRKTFDSLGRVLPNRQHIVLTRQHLQLPDEVEVINDIKDIITMASKTDDELFIIGGGNLFTQLLPYADRMYITKIDATFDGDVFFPDFDEKEWEIVSNEKGIRDENNPYDYYFLQ